MLADAADLAAQVSAEVGTLEMHSHAHNVPIDSLEPDGTEIQDKLHELEHLLDRTAGEIGASPANMSGSTPGASAALEVPDFMAEFMDTAKPEMPSVSESSKGAETPEIPDRASGPGAPPSSKAVESGASTAIPDFMSEFTHPDAAATSSTANPHALTPIATRNPPKLGVVGSPITPIEVRDEPELVGVMAPAPTAQAKPVAAPAVVSPGGPKVSVESVPPAPHQGEPAPIAADNAATPERSGGMVMPVATLLVRALETLDRPVSRLGPGPRKLIGLLALLMFTASIVVFAASLL